MYNKGRLVKKLDIINNKSSLCNFSVSIDKCTPAWSTTISLGTQTYYKWWHNTANYNKEEGIEK